MANPPVANYTLPVPIVVALWLFLFFFFLNWLS